MIHWQYLKYVLRHKWYVLVECFKIGLYWQGLVHDLSKFLPSEWTPYAEAFYGKFGYKYKPYEVKCDESNNPPESVAQGIANIEVKIKPLDLDWLMHMRTMDAFDVAWLLHQHRNPHHWQYWLLRGDQPLNTIDVSTGLKKIADAPCKILEMPDKYVKEMVCDWRGAGKAQGHMAPDDCKKWYLKNRDNIVLHPETRKTIEKMLEVRDEHGTCTREGQGQS